MENEERNRKIRGWLWVPIVTLVLGFPLVSSALPALPHTFTAGEPIVAAEINENFDHLQRGIEAVESRGAFCGTTAETAGRISAPNGLVGYPAARALCESACSSATAHMCTSHELALLAQEWTLPQGWYSTGEGDCHGWTESGSAVLVAYGLSWTGVHDWTSVCTDNLPVLCCD
jgi:hypothetical protein